MNEQKIRPSVLMFIFLSLFYFSADVCCGQDIKITKQAERAMREGDFAAAENLWRNAIVANPKQIKFRLGLSYSLFKQRKLTESYDEAKKIQQIEPQNSRAWALTGTALLNTGNFTAARRQLIYALELNPDEALASASLGMLNFFENKSRLAITNLRRAVQIEPKEPDYVFSLGIIAARLQEFEEAAKAYRRFLEIAPPSDNERRQKILGLIDFFGYLGAQKSLYAVGGKRETTVNCELVGNRPIINVRINNSSKLYKFVLDTGSGMTVISTETAERLGIKPIAKGGAARALGGDGKFKIVYGFLSSIEIGDVRVSRLPVYIRKFYDSGSKVDGYLGLEAIGKFLVTLDYGSKTFTLALPQNRKNSSEKTNAEQVDAMGQNNVTSIPFHFTSSGFLSSEVKLADVNVPLSFIIDTGAGISVVDETLVRQFSLNKSTEPSLMRVFGAAGVTENVPLINLPRITFGEQNREKMQAVVLNLQTINENAGFEQAGILGGNFWQNSQLTFDFRNARLILKRAKSS